MSTIYDNNVVSVGGQVLGNLAAVNEPIELDLEEQGIVSGILTTPKALKIIKTISTNTKLHFNKIHELIGGSKSALSSLLSSLEKKMILESNWETIRITDQNGKERPIYAKMYKIKENKTSLVITQNILPFLG